MHHPFPTRAPRDNSAKAPLIPQKAPLFDPKSSGKLMKLNSL
jgi:hypothetical protein